MRGGGGVDKVVVVALLLCGLVLNQSGGGGRWCLTISLLCSSESGGFPRDSTM